MVDWLAFGGFSKISKCVLYFHCTGIRVNIMGLSDRAPGNKVVTQNSAIGKSVGVTDVDIQVNTGNDATLVATISGITIIPHPFFYRQLFS